VSDPVQSLLTARDALDAALASGAWLHPDTIRGIRRARECAAHAWHFAAFEASVRAARARGSDEKQEREG
jgi:hypothetical protein